MEILSVVTVGMIAIDAELHTQYAMIPTAPNYVNDAEQMRSDE